MLTLTLVTHLIVQLPIPFSINIPSVRRTQVTTLKRRSYMPRFATCFNILMTGFGCNYIEVHGKSPRLSGGLSFGVF